ncbi:UBX domain-containing protein 10 [Termitomyces sp. J132]|nr:UBX domain-containing protein 10 [Termitomyces sp. J132]
MDHLDAGQRNALASLQNIVHADEDVAISVLDSVGWDVQHAVDLLFGHSAPPPPPTTTMQEFEIDDSDVRPLPPRSPSVYQLVARPLFAVFAVPLHVLSNIFRFIFGLLRIPVPQFRFTNLSFYTPRPRRSFGGPDRWVRELEEETGAVSISTGRTTAFETAAAGPSTLTARSRLADDTKVLPDFTLGSYDEALRTCEREARIGCIVLVSEEHDDVPDFKRSTLTNAEFVRILYDNNVVVWGGDVRDQEAYSAAEKLQATTYPFVAFVALQPRRNPSSSSRPSANPSPALTVLSRHQGPSSGPTSPSTLSSHLTTQLLPRVTPFLTRIQAQNAARERDRVLRSEQDAAFHATAARDRARIESKLAAEREAAERARAEEVEAELQRQHQLSLEHLKQTRLSWRRFIRRALTSSSLPASSGGLRIAIRLPTGQRIIHTFTPTQSLTSLYAFVGAQLVPSSLPPSEDPTTSPAGDAWDSANLELCLEKQISSAPEWWGFQLVSAYPRKEIHWMPGTQLGDVDVLKGGSQLVVELTGGARETAVGNGDDGYETESDEE